MIDIEKTIKEYNDFFKIDIHPKEINIVYLQSREEINAIRGKKTEKWVRAFTLDKTIYILDKNKLENESSHKYNEEEYIRCKKHELAHIYFRDKTGVANPRWLNEGLCIYLSEQLIEKKNTPKYFQNFLDFYSHGGEKMYYESGFAVKFLVETFGKDKFISILENLKNTNSKEEFVILFDKTYGFTLNYENFNTLYEKSI